MASRWFIVIESMGRWWVDCEGRAYGPFDSRTEASEVARRLAEDHLDSGQKPQIFSPDADGHYGPPVALPAWKKREPESE